MADLSRESARGDDEVVTRRLRAVTKQCLGDEDFESLLHDGLDADDPLDPQPARTRIHLENGCDDCARLQVDWAVRFVMRRQPSPDVDDPGRLSTVDLLWLLDHEEPSVRAAAVRAVPLLEAWTDPVLARLDRARKDGDTRVEDAAGAVLAELQSAQPDLAPSDARSETVQLSNAAARTKAFEERSLVVSARFDAERTETCDLRLQSGAILSVRSGAGEGLPSGMTIALTTDSPLLAEPDRLAVRVVHDATRHAKVRFLDRRGRAVVPMPAGLRGAFRVEVAPTIARFGGPVLTASKAAAAQFGSQSPPEEIIIKAPDGSVTVTVTKRPNGHLEVHAQANEPQQLQNATVHVRFLAANGDEVLLQGEGNDAVDVTFPLSFSRDGKSSGAWMNKVEIPRDVSEVDFVVFPEDDVVR